MPPLSVPTTSALSSSQLIPSSHPAVIKTLTRLTRSSLISLVLDWLDPRNQENTPPLLYADDLDNEDNLGLYPLATNLDALREIYVDLQTRNGSKRDVVDRVIEGDWRGGINIYQLAMADMQYLYDHPSSQKWSALKLVRLDYEEDMPNSKPKPIPRFHPATFLRNLQKEALPDVKTHYNLDRHPTLPLSLLRIFIIESPYNTSLAFASQKLTMFDSSKIFYIAFPDDSPFVYVSLATPVPAGQLTSRSDTKSLRNLMLEGVAKAFSRPRSRYRLDATAIAARNLAALVERRGGGRTNAAGGGWGIYAEGKKDGSDNPLNIQLPSPDPSVSDAEQEKVENSPPRGMKRRIVEDSRVVKRRKLVAKGRFGNTALPDDGKGIERLDVRIADPFLPATASEDQEDYALADELGDTQPTKRKGRRSTISTELAKEVNEDDGDRNGFRPDICITFHGPHVFAGIRQLVEAGIIDGEKMPGWMTGEEGVSVGLIRDGRIKGNRGSGM